MSGWDITTGWPPTGMYGCVICICGIAPIPGINGWDIAGGMIGMVGCGGIGGTIACGKTGCMGIGGRPGGIAWFTGGLTNDFNGSNGLKLPAPVGVRVGVPPTADSDAIKTGGRVVGTSNPRNFKLINLHAMLNSSMFILPSESVSASALFE